MKRALLGILTLALPGIGLCLDDPSAPSLQMETGMHTAIIKSVAVDEAGRYAVTGSDDKTIRIWDLASGQALRTLRPFVGAGDRGRIYSVAISPDGAVIAAGGQLGEHILLFDRVTGRVLRPLQGLHSSVNNLSFSLDGGHVAAALGSGELRLYRTADGQDLGRDRSCGRESYGVDFSPSGHLVSTCFDGFLRLYGPDLKLLAEVRAPGGARPHGVRFSPDGQKVALGYGDQARVDVLSGLDLALLYGLEVHDLGNGLPSVEWSRDGRTLYAAGVSRDDDRMLIHAWTDGAAASRRDFKTQATSTIRGLASLPGGRIAFGSGGPVWGILGRDGETIVNRSAEIANFRSGGSSFKIDPTGSTVWFGYEKKGTSPALFATEERVFALDPAPDKRLKAASLQAPGLNVNGWDDTEDPTLNGRPLKLSAYEIARSLAVAPDGRSFLLGSDWNLRSFDHRGKERWRIPAPSVAWIVNLSGDGRLAVAAFSDGTIRWYRAADGKELLALFPHADRQRWVVWTPSGYYDASVEGEELIGWHVNRGMEEAADFFPASHFRDRFYRPDVVARVLNTLDEAKALDLADAEGQRKPSGMAFDKLLPPVVTLLSPSGEIEVQDTSLLFRVAVRSPSGEPVTAVRAYIDGRPAALARDVVFEPGTPTVSGAEQTHSFSVSVPKRDCTVAIAAETRLANSEPVPVKVRWAAPAPLAEKPTLYLFAVGVGAYANPTLKLDLPAKDARDIEAAWKLQEGGLYAKVEARVLTDGEATKNAILSGLEWLETQTTQKDVAVLFFAGHGINDPRTGEYLFLPHEADLASRRVTLLPHREVLSALAALPGKVLVFLDTCHSGNLLGTKTRDASDLTRLLNEMASAESGLVVFSATTGRGLAQETKSWDNGAFTKALLEALGGKADQDKDKSIWIAEIETYLGQRVRELTGGLQTPATAKPDGLPDFPVAVTGQR
jgi:WD40 repeat protein